MMNLSLMCISNNFPKAQHVWTLNLNSNSHAAAPPPYKNAGATQISLLWQKSSSLLYPTTKTQAWHLVRSGIRSFAVVSSLNRCNVSSTSTCSSTVRPAAAAGPPPPASTFSCEVQRAQRGPPSLLHGWLAPGRRTGWLPSPWRICLQKHQQRWSVFQRWGVPKQSLILSFMLLQLNNQTFSSPSVEWSGQLTRNFMTDKTVDWFQH